MSKRRTTDEYWYHAYFGHNSPDWWFLDWMHDGPTKPHYGGFTLYINPEMQTISIGVCSGGDRFSRKMGRAVAENRYVNSLSRLRFHESVWYVITPPLADGDDFTHFLRKEAFDQAIRMLTEEHGGKDFVALTVVTPKLLKEEDDDLEA